MLKVVEEKAPVYFEPEPMVIPEPEPEPEPIKPEICNAPKGVLEGVDFGSNSANLTAGAKLILDSILADLKDFPKVELEIKAYTDSVGSDGANLKLSENRAASVKAYLYKGGITKIVSFGLGENNPIASNDTAEGRALNRRVELKILSNECGALEDAGPAQTEQTTEQGESELLPN